MAQRDRTIKDQDVVREFLIESSEHLRSLEHDLAELECSPHCVAVLGSIYRTIHTIKGTCGFFGLTHLENLAHDAEDLLTQIRSADVAPSPRQISQILDAANTIVSLLRVSEAGPQMTGTVWDKLPLWVGHLSQSLGKQIQLEINVDTEIDRSILDAITGPLTHLIRNACDHGIETPHRRLRSGKSAHGTLQLRAYRDRNNITIEIADDGAGMTADVLDRAFVPGFTTAPALTKVSGRGMGMDVVKSNIERVGGCVEIATRPGQGTTVSIRIPFPPPPILEENYRYLQNFLYQESGIVLEAGKHYLLEARLLGLAREQGVTTLNDLCALLRVSQDQPLKQRVVDALTTNETYFFREPKHYDVLRDVLLPHAPSRPLRFWSAASSTGQEAYSLSMALIEAGLRNAEILGTDLCSGVLDRARSGIYSRLEMTRGLPASFAAKYFQPIGPQWQVNAELKRMVRFAPFDLRSSMRELGPFDGVFCRNVLIYFDLSTKLRILDEIHRTLVPGGYLFLGSTEADLPVSDRFQRRSLGEATIYIAR